MNDSSVAINSSLFQIETILKKAEKCFPPAHQQRERD